jgi:hypothetical protein
VLNAGFQNHCGTRLRARKLAYHQQRRSSVFNRALKTEPRGQRDPSHKFFRNSSEIEDNQPEAAALKDQVCGF